LAKDFLAKNNVTTLENPPYTPDLTLADFCLFLRVKSALKGRRFCFVVEVIKVAMRELKRLLQMASRNVPTVLQSLAQTHICNTGEF
jgi:hypothetical protein